MKSLIIILLSLPSLIFCQDKLRWAADAESGAPYVFQDPKLPSHLIGFEHDIISAVAEKIGRDPIFVQNQWDGLIPGLQRGDYDAAINGLEITEDRKQVVDFSIPYYITHQQLVVRHDEQDINSLSDLSGKIAGTLKSSLAERMLRAVGGIDVRTYESEVNSYADLENGRLDAVLIDAPVALYYAAWNSQLKLVGQPIAEINYGIVINKDNKKLLDEVNSALREMFRSGELRKILERWNLWNYSMALYLDDRSVSNTPHDKFDRFLESQGKQLSFEDYVARYLSFMPVLARAALMTTFLTITSMILAIFLGLIVAIARVYGPKFISLVAVVFIEVIRGTPLLIQLFFIFYALPELGIMLSPLAAAIIGLGVNYSAYAAETYRAGLNSVPKGQFEAAYSLGFNRDQTLQHIVIPQAFRLVIPPITNDFISLLKDSSLVSVITLVELTKAYGQLASTYYDYIGTGIIVALIYLLLGMPFVQLSRLAESHFSPIRVKRNKKDSRSNNV